MASKTNRQSNIELYRIFCMLLIVAHHYVVNSGINDILFPGEISIISLKGLYLFAFGAWGKTAINSFVLITGYFMCNSKVSLQKWLSLLFEYLFYNILIYSVFILFKYENFSLREMIKTISPFLGNNDSFTNCFLLFYFSIPFLNVLIRNLSKKQFQSLLLYSLAIFSVLASIPFVSLHVGYIFWFMIIYIVGAYMKLYPPSPQYNNWQFWLIATICSVILSITIAYFVYRLNGTKYFLLADSNRISSVIVSVSSFMLFINLPINYSRIINTVGKSTFGVLLIHANSDTMRQWLWEDTLHNSQIYETSFIYIHSLLSVIGVFAICSIIEILRITLLTIISKNFHKTSRIAPNKSRFDFKE